MCTELGHHHKQQAMEITDSLPIKTNLNIPRTLYPISAIMNYEKAFRDHGSDFKSNQMLY